MPRPHQTLAAPVRWIRRGGASAAWHVVADPTEENFDYDNHRAGLRVAVLCGVGLSLTHGGWDRRAGERFSRPYSKRAKVRATPDDEQPQCRKCRERLDRLARREDVPA